MPKFVNPGAAESFREKIRQRVKERRIYCAEKVHDVLPGPLDDPLPKREVFDLATDTAIENGLDEHPFFKGDGSRFRTYLRRNWSPIRHISEELGVGIEHGHGLAGIRRGGKVGLRKTAEWSTQCLETQAEGHNRTVENMKDLVALPSVQLNLLPAANA